MKKNDLVMILIFILFGVLMLGSTLTTLDKGLGSVLFPAVASSLIIILSIVFLFTEKVSADGSEPADHSFAKTLKIFGLILGFIFAIRYVSYLAVIPIFASAILYFASKLKPKTILITVLVLQVFVYLVFYNLLQIRIC